MFGWINHIIQQASASTFMPAQGSAVAEQVDSLYAVMLWASGISCILVIGGLIYFAFKYRRQSDSDKTAYITHNNFLEFLWSFIPFCLFIWFFVWGLSIYHEMKTYPSNALEVHAVGQKWYWEFQYKSGRKIAKEFYVPVDTPVKMIITSKDVLHSFFIPGMRIKQDAVPGRYTAIGFTANKEGSYQIFCAEFCGDEHSSMLAKMHVVSLEKYEDWLANDPNKGLSPAEIGQKIYQTRCIACHKLTDEVTIGPGFKGLFGSTRTFEKADAVVADENYIRESMLDPQKKIVKGFSKQFMTSFQGQLSEAEVMGVIEFLKTLK